MSIYVKVIITIIRHIRTTITTAATMSNGAADYDDGYHNYDNCYHLLSLLLLRIHTFLSMTVEKEKSEKKTGD